MGIAIYLFLVAMPQKFFLLRRKYLNLFKIGIKILKTEFTISIGKVPTPGLAFIFVSLFILIVYSNFLGLKFEPAEPSDSTPVTYFDFRGREFDSSQRVPACATPWTLDETNALSGIFDGLETCCLYDVCNFGRGHCGGTVISSYGFKSYGGCGSQGPIIG